MTYIASSSQFNAAIDKYYKLKYDDNKSIQKFIKNIRDNSLLSVTEKQEKFREFKGKCIKCGKTGKTIFTQDGNMLIAHCGHSDSPCKLNIQLQRAKYNNLFTAISDQSSIVNNKKIDIILTKLNYLFGFSNEATTIEIFNKLKLELIDEVKKYQKFNEKYIDIVENKSNKEKIMMLNNALFSLIQNIKEQIKEFEESGDTQFIKDVGELYVNQIIKIVKELQELKYQIQYIYTEDNEYHLVQKTYSQSEMQVIVPGTENKIIAFII